MLLLTPFKKKIGSIMFSRNAILINFKAKIFVETVKFNRSLNNRPICAPKVSKVA